MMEKVSWTEHITNDEVLQMVDEKRSLIATIREKTEELGRARTTRRLPS